LTNGRSIRHGKKKEGEAAGKIQFTLIREERTSDGRRIKKKIDHLFAATGEEDVIKSPVPPTVISESRPTILPAQGESMRRDRRKEIRGRQQLFLCPFVGGVLFFFSQKAQGLPEVKVKGIKLPS